MKGIFSDRFQFYSLFQTTRHTTMGQALDLLSSYSQDESMRKCNLVTSMFALFYFRTQIVHKNTVVTKSVTVEAELSQREELLLHNKHRIMYSYNPIYDDLIFDYLL